MTANPSQLVQKLWNYCNILRDDDLSYGDFGFPSRPPIRFHGGLCGSRTVVVEQLPVR
jgi:hypothetical protein